MREQVHKDTIELAVERWNAHDARYFDVYADELASHGFPPDVPPTLEGVKGLFHQMWSSFPDIRIDPLRLVVEGDLAAGHLRITGTHEGEFMGAPPTGNRIEVEAMLFLRFGPDGKVHERWTRLDEMSLLTQLGLIQAPVSAPA